MTEAIYKLCDIPEGSKIMVEVENTEDGKYGLALITFHRLDRPYSYCTFADGGVAYLNADTPLTKNGDFYEIWTPKVARERAI